MTEFKVPELGENVASGDVAKVLVSVGDTVKMEQPVIELETDKATIEVPSSVAGVVKEIKVKKGDKVQVGAVIFTVDDGAAAGNGASGNGAGKAAAKAEPAKAEPAQEATPEPKPEPKAEVKSEPQKVVPMPPRQPAEAPPAPAPPAVAQPAPSSAVPAAASPAVRRLAREIGVDINAVAGSGPAGRISQEDVKEHARRILSSVGSAGAPAAGGAMAARASRPMPDFAKWGEVQREAWSNIRRVTSEHLSYSWNTVPHVTQFDKADVTALEDLRKKYKDQVVKAGGNLTVTAMLVKILATALQKFPQFNASIDPDRGEIIYKKYVSVGVAVDTDRGLLVPVIKDANRKNITQIAVDLQQLAEKARDRKLTVEEMSGGSMSLSNLGGIGGTYFTPIVNWPEVAILGVSRGGTEPVWKDGQFVPRQMLPLSLSYDHRLIDGADAIRFLRWVVEAIEQPFLLSLIG
ncbi:MAG TPA: 2-oxo acid dehydrogenase subunit E2 [Vicinamibacterales bacterium]|nr:2-oxo acid dehydrogenase subunit E2 [Vicinamibacterales bacterium]